MVSQVRQTQAQAQVRQGEDNVAVVAPDQLFVVPNCRIDNHDKDNGGNPRIWFRPLGSRKHPLKDSDGNLITSPSRIPVYSIIGGIDAYVKEHGDRIHKIYVLSTSIKARYDLVTEGNLRQYLELAEYTSIEEIPLYPFREKPESDRAHLGEETLRREAADGSIIQKGGFVRGLKRMGVDNQTIAAGVLQNFQKGVSGVVSSIDNLLGGK